MKKWKFALAAGSLLCVGSLGAQSVPYMVEDINPIGNSDINNGIVGPDGRFYFGAVDANGNEPWHTDGVGATGVNVRPGAANGNPLYLGMLGSRLFLTAHFGAPRGEPYSIDINAVGTPGEVAAYQLVLDVNNDPGADGSGVTSGVASGGFFYFQGTNAAGHQGLYRMDAAGVGTAVKDDIKTTAGPANISNFLAMADGRILFRATDDTGLGHVWISDGTVPGQLLLRATIIQEAAQWVMWQRERASFCCTMGSIMPSSLVDQGE